MDDATFDPEFHISSVDLGGEGTMRVLEDTVARLHQERIPKDHPMWRTVVITGLEGGRVAHYSAVHHVCVDGMGGQEPLHLLSDLTPETTWYHPEDREPEERPSQASLYLHALGRLTKSNFEQLRGMPQSIQAAGTLVGRAISAKKNFGALTQSAPETSFNVEIDEERRLALGKWPLADFKGVSKKLGCTVNDVFMAVASGALRRFFLRRGELPEEPLLAGCPVSIRSAGDTAQNNQLSMMVVSLETHIEDPLDRLVKIRESAEVGKEVSADLFSADSPEVHAFGLPGLMSGTMRMMESFHLSKHLFGVINIAISNVPGPPEQLYINGAEMTAMYPVSLPLHGTGVNLTVISYHGSMDFSITAAAKALDEPQELRDDLLAAFEEIRALVMDTS